MSDTLVERLRREASLLRAHAYGDPILEEAADEIERLKAEARDGKAELIKKCADRAQLFIIAKGDPCYDGKDVANAILELL